jgi:hypothetical protein
VDPNLWTSAQVNLTTSAVAQTVYTNSTAGTQLPSVVTIKSAEVALNPASTAGGYCYWILRRLPSGYSAPAITVASGLTSFVDQPDIFGVAVCVNSVASATTPDITTDVDFFWLRKRMVFYPGDTLILQAIEQNNSASFYEAIVLFNTSVA